MVVSICAFANMDWIDLDEQTMNSKKVKLTAMIIRWFHQKAMHERRNVTLNELRASEYWVI